MGEVGVRKCTIPARSSHINPIENIFYIVKQRLHQDVRLITREDFAAFSTIVKSRQELRSIILVGKTPFHEEESQGTQRIKYYFCFYL